LAGPKHWIEIFGRLYVVRGKELVLLLLSSSLWSDCCLETCVYGVEEVLGRIYNAYVLSSVSVCIARQARATD
jgi:hypothetical protein